MWRKALVLKLKLSITVRNRFEMLSEISVEKTNSIALRWCKSQLKKEKKDKRKKKEKRRL